MQRLKMLAEPFVDTPDTVVTRLLDHFDRTQVPPPSTGQRQTEGPPSLPLQRYDPLSPPGLTHTKVLSAIVDGRSAANWNDLVDQAHLAAMRRVNDANSLWTLSKSQTHKGRRTDRGYHYLEDIDMSIQAIDANYAWRNALHLARELGFSIRVEFMWREKPRAANPGMRGALEWSPSTVETR